MTQSIRTTFFSRGTMVAALVSALLGIAAFMAISPASASADSPTTCDPGEFCLWSGYNMSGGLYQNKGDDGDLRNNVFTPCCERVNANSKSAYNHGVAQSNGRNDVIVYNRPYFQGDSACITLGRLLRDLFAFNPAIGLYENWRDQIMSFKWATHSECVPHGVLVNG
jgi:hypothetical protein